MLGKRGKAAIWKWWLTGKTIFKSHSLFNTTLTFSFWSSSKTPKFKTIKKTSIDIISCTWGLKEEKKMLPTICQAKKFQESWQKKI